MTLETGERSTICLKVSLKFDLKNLLFKEKA